MLSSLTLGLILPLIQVSFNSIINTNDIAPYILETIQVGDSIQLISGKSTISALVSFFQIIYILGLLFMLTKFILGLNKIKRIHKSGLPTNSNKSLILTKLNHPPFSFLKWIYINRSERKTYNKNQWDALIEHENIHLKEHHSIDNLFVAVLKIIFWWSPFIYSFQKALLFQHEFIADSKALENMPKGKYIDLLSNTVQRQHTLSFVNNFHHQLKNRLIMLLKKDTNQPNKFIYLWMIPLALLLFLTISCNKETDSNQDTPAEILSDQSNSSDSDVFKIVEDMPLFKGCESELNKKAKKECAQKKMLEYIYTHITYPKEAKEKGIEGVAVINFIVDKTGKIKNAKIVKNPGAGTGNESLRVVESMPNWTPGKQAGKEVSVSYNLPIKFKLQ